MALTHLKEKLVKVLALTQPREKAARDMALTQRREKAVREKAVRVGLNRTTLVKREASTSTEVEERVVDTKVAAPILMATDTKVAQARAVEPKVVPLAKVAPAKRVALQINSLVLVGETMASIYHAYRRLAISLF